MKKISTIVAVIVLFFSASAFATGDKTVNPDNVTAKVQTLFSQDFSAAASVVWKKNEGYYFANFMLNGKKVSAAYNEDGELLGTSQTITAAELPLNVSLAISKRYGQYTMDNEITVINLDGVTSYYPTVKNDKQVIDLKCSNSGEIEVVSKSKK